MQWLATAEKERTRLFTRRQVGNSTDKVSVDMVWEWNICDFHSSTDHYCLTYYMTATQSHTES